MLLNLESEFDTEKGMQTESGSDCATESRSEELDSKEWRWDDSDLT